MKIKNRQIRPPDVKTAAVYSLFTNIIIYLLFLVMYLYGRNAVIPFENEHPTPPTFTVWIMIYVIIHSYIYIFALYCVNFYILGRKNLRHPAKVIIAIVISVLFIYVWNSIFMIFHSYAFDIELTDPRAVRGNMARDMVLGALVIFISQMMYSNYRRQLISIENESLKAEYERARYEALKNQIDPHFLFNTMNTLNSIIPKDPQKAQKYLQKLSSIFRYTIQDKENTTLEEELKFSKDYSDLMQIRYGTNLIFKFNIDQHYNSYNIVPFSIQTLIENAIKHNMITSRQPLTITVSTDNGGNSVTVSNPVNPKKNPEPGEGIGLANLSERYKLKWGEDITIRQDKEIFSVSLPLIHNLQKDKKNNYESSHNRR